MCSSDLVEVVFDPRRVHYEELLSVFWDALPSKRISPGCHGFEPTIFCYDEEQCHLAEESKGWVQAMLGDVVTASIAYMNGFIEADEPLQKQFLRGNRELWTEFETLCPDGRSLIESTAATRVNGFLAGHATPRLVAGTLDLLGLSKAGSEELLRIVMAARRQAGAHPDLPDTG